MSIILSLIWVVLFVLTITTAQKNNRNMLVWGVVGLIFSPVISLVSLWLIGRK